MLKTKVGTFSKGKSLVTKPNETTTNVEVDSSVSVSTSNESLSIKQEPSTEAPASTITNSNPIEDDFDLYNRYEVIRDNSEYGPEDPFHPKKEDLDPMVVNAIGNLSERFTQINPSNVRLDPEPEFAGPMEYRAFENNKLFLSEDKEFFTTRFVRKVAEALISTHVMDSEDTRNAATELLTYFVKLAKEVKSSQKKYGTYTNVDLIDMLLINTCAEINDRLTKKIL